jgi:hypothetical protein
MANRVPDGSVWPIVSSAVEGLELGGAGHGFVGTMLLQLVGSGAWDGTATIKARATAKPGDTPAAYTTLGVAYILRTSSPNTVQNTGLTGASMNHIIEIDAAGLDILVDHTGRTAGTLTIHRKVMQG